MTEDQLDQAKDILLDQMRIAGCDPLGIESVGFACDARPFELAVARAEYYFHGVGAVPPTVEDILAQL